METLNEKEISTNDSDLYSMNKKSAVAKSKVYKNTPEKSIKEKPDKKITKKKTLINSEAAHVEKSNEIASNSKHSAQEKSIDHVTQVHKSENSSKHFDTTSHGRLSVGEVVPINDFVDDVASNLYSQTTSSEDLSVRVYKKAGSIEKLNDVLSKTNISKEASKQGLLSGVSNSSLNQKLKVEPIIKSSHSSRRNIYENETKQLDNHSHHSLNSNNHSSHSLHSDNHSHHSLHYDNHSLHSDNHPHHSLHSDIHPQHSLHPDNHSQHSLHPDNHSHHSLHVTRPSNKNSSHNLNLEIAQASIKHSQISLHTTDEQGLIKRQSSKISLSVKSAREEDESIIPINEQPKVYSKISLSTNDSINSISDLSDITTPKNASVYVANEKFSSNSSSNNVLTSEENTEKSNIGNNESSESEKLVEKTSLNVPDEFRARESSEQSIKEDYLDDHSQNSVPIDFQEEELKKKSQELPSDIEYKEDQIYVFKANF